MSRTVIKEIYDICMPMKERVFELENYYFSIRHGKGLSRWGAIEIQYRGKLISYFGSVETLDNMIYIQENSPTEVNFYIKNPVEMNLSDVKYCTYKQNYDVEIQLDCSTDENLFQYSTAYKADFDNFVKFVDACLWIDDPRTHFSLYDDISHLDNALLELKKELGMKCN